MCGCSTTIAGQTIDPGRDRSRNASPAATTPNRTIPDG